MAKDYSLMVEEILELESTFVMGYQSKGHHNRFNFTDIIIEKLDPVRKERYSREYIKKHSYHKWAKSVPWAGGGRRIVYRDEKQKGWYPVTVFLF